jgi:hypothetical protein
MSVWQPQYTLLFDKLLAQPPPHYYLHVLLPGGAESLGQPGYELEPGTKSSLVGTLTRIVFARRNADATLTLVVQGLCRGAVLRPTQYLPYSKGDVQVLPDAEALRVAARAAARFTRGRPAGAASAAPSAAARRQMVAAAASVEASCWFGYEAVQLSVDEEGAPAGSKCHPWPCPSSAAALMPPPGRGWQLWLAALTGPVFPRGEAGPLCAQPLPRVLDWPPISPALAGRIGRAFGAGTLACLNQLNASALTECAGSVETEVRLSLEKLISISPSSSGEMRTSEMPPAKDTGGEEEAEEAEEAKGAEEAEAVEEAAEEEEAEEAEMTVVEQLPSGIDPLYGDAGSVARVWLDAAVEAVAAEEEEGAAAEAEAEAVEAEEVAALELQARPEGDALLLY